MKKRLIPLLLAAMLSPVVAGDNTNLDTSATEAELDLWDESSKDSDTKQSNWNVGGFVEAGLGGFTHGNRPIKKDFSLAELRGEIFANRYVGPHFFSAKLDIVVDDIDDRELRAEVRELFVNFKLGDNASLKVGQQVLTWGTGDFIFINDLFSKDWQSMFSGRDDSYLKKPDPAVKFSYFSEVANIDLAWVPVFDGDEYISGERFAYYNPMAGGVTDKRLSVENPDNDFDNSAFALRLSKNIGGTEYALYGYHGLYSQPSAFNPVSGKNVFPKMNALGASVRGTLAGGIANAEVSYWNFLGEKDGSNPFVPNDQLNLLLGYEHEIAPNVTLSGQYLVQKMQDYDQARRAAPNPSQLVDEWHQTATIRLNWQAMQQKLNVSLFAFYSPDDKDFYLKPKVSYRQDDHWFYEVGANVFGGKHNYTQWGQFEKDSNIYARLKYNF
ncbi:MAG: hypothetical protein CSA44_02045 [Gammaproteobacteria bacterium]|nr:MAG: hypothetical protein CSA44_02045 [Gammaproteobacteria bacterium]